MRLEVLIWLVLSVIGLGVTLYGVREAFLDRKSVQGSPDGRLLIADQRLFAQAVRFAVFVMWVVLAFALNLLVVLLLTANVLLVIVALSDIYVGRQLRR